MEPMQTTEEYTPEVPLAAIPANVQLVNWPMRDEPVASWLLVSGCIVMSLGVGWLGQNMYMSLVAIGAFAVTLWRLWVPVRFELSPKGVVQSVFRRRRRIPWSSIKRCQIRRHGVLLLPTSDRSPISQLSGLYLSWGNQKESLLNCVHHYLGSRTDDALAR